MEILIIKSYQIFEFFFISLIHVKYLVTHENNDSMKTKK